MIEKELDKYWKSVVNTIQDGLMIVNKEGTVVSVNKALLEMLGFERHEMIGKKCDLLQCDIYDQVRCKEGEHWCQLFHSGHVEFTHCRVRKKNGDYLYVNKSAGLLRDKNNEVIGAVETITDISTIVASDPVESDPQGMPGDNEFHGIIGASPRMRQLNEMIVNAAYSDAPVIITGESGTGKELVSRAIHKIGPRHDYPFVKVNCAALSGSLLESELFGHVKGAFTGAYKDRVGRFETARGGDMLLDEIGDLPMEIQVKLLRVLEEKVIERVGDSAPRPVDVRIITATNRDLEELVAKGRLREDFYFRINVIPITVPPLRERVEDIPLLAQAFFNRIRGKQKNRPVTGISDETLAVLKAYSWPGNVRELKSAFEYAVVFCRDSLIQPTDLPASIQMEVKRIRKSKTHHQRSEDPPASPVHTEKQALIAALNETHGNQSEAARLLGVSRVTVYNRMKKHGIVLDRRPTV